MTNQAETIAAVAAELSSSVVVLDEQNMPGKYRYHMFSGFPGFWCFCAKAGLVLAAVEDERETSDGWGDFVINYCGTVMSFIEQGMMPSEEQLKAAADDAAENYLE